MKIKDLMNLNKKGKDLLITISTILGILALILTAVLLIYQFMVYIYEMQWFYYWSINEKFYIKNNTDIINGLIYGFSIICILILILLSMYKIPKGEEKNKRDWFILFLFFLFLNAMLGLKDIYQKGLLLENAIVYIIGSIIIFLLIKYYAKKAKEFFIKFKEDSNFDKTLKDIALDILLLIVGIFISIVAMGNARCFFERDYEIISDDNKCNVILYSSSNYYIVSDCNIDDKNNTLIVHKGTQRKIDNFNISCEIITFSKIRKE